METQRALALSLLLTTGLTAQQLATFDPSALPNQEFAAVACPPAPPSAWTAQLVTPPSAVNWWSGAIAGDNKNQRLYHTTGFAPDGIQRLPYGAIGTGAAPTNFLAPPGFNQVTGMVVDPSVTSGDVLFVTDGFAMVRYHAPSGTIMAGPFAGPAPVGNFLTGMAHNPFNNRVYVIDDASAVWSRALGGGPWVGPVGPGFAPPGRATGISFCKTMPGAPIASYWGGLVLDLNTGANHPFPGAPAGIRHHRGLTFVAIPLILGGSGFGPPPVVEIENGFASGSNGTVVVVSSTGPAILAVDLVPTFGPGLNHPFVDGILMVNPATMFTLSLGAGNTTIPLGLVGVPPGIGLTFQAIGLTPNLTASDAIYMMTHK